MLYAIKDEKHNHQGEPLSQLAYRSIFCKNNEKNPNKLGTRSLKHSHGKFKTQNEKNGIFSPENAAIEQ